MRLARIKGIAFRLQNEIIIFMATFGLVSSNRPTMAFIGNKYSGYWFPKNLIHASGTVWGVGLGMDSSFEVELGKGGYTVVGFEPDSVCIAHARVEFESINSEIHAFGLWDKNGVFESFGSSISLVNIFDNSIGNRDSLQIQDIHEVASLLKLNEQKSPLVLKMNIEGAEREILLRIVDFPLPFEVIMFQAEFLLHLGFFKIFKKLYAMRELRLIIKGLISNDYLLVHSFRNQFTLVSKNI